MRNFIIKVFLITSPTNQPDSIIVTLPNNSMQIGPIEEVVSSNIYEAAWNELCKCFGERMQQDELDLMDAVLKGVRLEADGNKG